MPYILGKGKDLILGELPEAGKVIAKYTGLSDIMTADTASAKLLGNAEEHVGVGDTPKASFHEIVPASDMGELPF